MAGKNCSHSGSHFIKKKFPENFYGSSRAPVKFTGENDVIFSGPKFSCALRNARKRFRELYGIVFGLAKFSGLLRNARLACVSQKTRKLLGPENGPVNAPKQLSGVSQSAREFRARENTSFFPVNFTGALELPKTLLGTDFIAIKLHLRGTVFGNKDDERPKRKGHQYRT